MQKSKSIIRTSAILFLLLLVPSGCKGDEKKSIIDHEENIVRYKRLLEKDPNSCLYLEQIAGSYQALNQFAKAIKFYTDAVTQCKDSTLDKFQLGVCYYLTMEREAGIRYMNNAIAEAKSNNDSKMVSMLIQEKESWLEKWEQVKLLEWNKNKIEKR